MSNALPKEKQTAYQRWELASFGEDRPKASPTTAASAAKIGEQVTAAREQAHKEGFAAGLQEGRETGLQQGLQQGRAQAAQEVAQFTRIARQFHEELAQANELIAQDVLDLSLDLARTMLKTALAVRPELILPIILEAVHYLPSVQQPAVLTLHPDDAKIVRQYMGEELTKSGWRLSEDPQMDRGGCRVETASNQIDATTPTRWQRITSSLGKDHDWLAP